jgi:hypothetical protein
MNDQLATVLSRERLTHHFGLFSRRVVAKFRSVLIAHDPVVEAVIRRNMNGGSHASAPREWLPLPANRRRRRDEDQCLHDFRTSNSHAPLAQKLIDSLMVINAILLTVRQSFPGSLPSAPGAHHEHDNGQRPFAWVAL